MSLSELISSVAQPLLDLLPQIHARPASNEIAVIDSLWSDPRTFRGPMLHIPALSHIEVYSASEIPIDTGLQSLTSVDGKTVAVNATTILRVRDPILLRTIAGTEWEEWASMKIRGIVCDVVTCHKWTQSLAQAAEFIEAESYEELWPCGLNVQVVVLEDATETIPLRLFQ